MTKYHKLKPQEKQLKPPLEQKLIKLTSLALLTFLTALLTSSLLAPVQPTNADELLFAAQATGDSVSLSTTGNINLSMETSVASSIRTAEDTVYVSSGSNGYQLYVSTATDTNALIRDGTTGNDAADTIPATSTTSILSPTALTNDTWGFATLAKNSGTGSEDVVENGFDSSYGLGDNSNPNNKFIAVPAKGSDILVAKRTTSASTVPTNFYYAVKATTAKPSGLYKSTITYTAIGNGTTASMASVSPSRTNQIQGGETLTITTTNTLDLSSIASTTVTVGGVECTNATPVKNNSITNVTCTSPALSTGWHEIVVNFTTINDTVETYTVNPGIEYYLDEGQLELATYMQDFTIYDCISMSINTSTILMDKRDNNIYTVSRLADGNCWMSQNLRLGTKSDNSGVQSVTLTPDDSNVSANYTITADAIQTTTGLDWSTNYDETHVYSFAGTTNDKTYGNLYNWFTATAGTGTQNGVTGGADAPSSICPKGWTLPPNTGNGSYTNLFQTLSANGGLGLTVTGSTSSGTNITISDTNAVHSMRRAPYNFTLPGNYNEGTIANLDFRGVYWSRTSDTADVNNVMAFWFGLDPKYNLQYTSRKYSGRSIRCNFLVPTMQNFTTTLCSNLETAKTITLKDNRDGNFYTAAKLPDNHCWMTSNLRLGNTTSSAAITINSTNSDFAGTAFTISSSQVITSAGANWDNDPDNLHIFARTNNIVDANGNPLGNLYNWFTATAKSGSTSTAANVNAPYSICPKGWKLPPYTNNYSIAALVQVSEENGGLGVTGLTGTNATVFGTTAKIAQSPYYFPIAGYYVNGTLTNVGVFNSYWQRTSQNTTFAYYFGFGSGGAYYLQGNNNGSKNVGRSIRCVLTS